MSAAPRKEPTLLLDIPRYLQLMFDEHSRPSKRTVQRWIEAGELTHAVVRYGRRVFIRVPRAELPSGLVTGHDERRVAALAKTAAMRKKRPASKAKRKTGRAKA